MTLPQSPHAPISISRPEPWGVCDRCGARWTHRRLQWQYEWRGLTLQNLRLLVCPPCLDVPQDQLKPIIIGPDPVPVRDPRPGYATTQEGFTPTFSVIELLEDNPYQPGAATVILTDTPGDLLTDTSGVHLTAGD